MAGPREIGDYWINDNAQFEATKPSFRDRLVRSLDPRTSYGSAFGQFASGVRDGSLHDAVLGIAQSVPAFAAMKVVPAAAWTKDVATAIPDGLRTALKYVLPSTATAGYDTARAAPPAPPPPPVTTYTPRNASLGIRG